MGCFDNIIALKETCASVTPTSGIYLNDVGVTLDLVNSVITKDYSGPSDFVNSKINFSVTSVKNEVYAYFANQIKTKSLIDNSRIGYTVPNMVTVTGGGYRGVSFSVYNNANFFTLELAGIELHTNFTGVIPVLIYDLDQNLLLDTVNVDAVAGVISSAFPHISYRSDRKYLNLWIGYDSTGINSYKTVTHKGQCCGVYCLTNNYVRARGASVSGTFIESNLTGLQDTAGISLLYSLSCDPFGWMCNFSNILALPIAYKTAADIYRTGILVTPGTRSNNSTTVNSEVLKSAFEWHEMKYRESMDNILKRISVPKDSVCFECNGQVKNTVILP